MIEIVKATREDLPNIAEVEKLCFEEGIAYSLKKLTEKFDKAPDRFYVVYDNGIIVSYFWTELWKEDPSTTLYDLIKTSEHSNDNNDIMYIGNVCVVPSARGKGIAKECMRFMLKEISNVMYAILAVDSSNSIAIHIYEELGFMAIDKIENYYSPVNSKGKSAIIMAFWA